MVMVVNVGDSEGPVLRLINNRIRDLQMQLQQDPITQEQITIILSLITQLNNLRQPISAALAQEIRQHTLNQQLLSNNDNASTSHPQRPQQEIVASSGRATAIAATGGALGFLSNEINMRNQQTPNVSSRLATRELETNNENSRDRQFVYSRFRQSYSNSNDDLFTCITSLRGCYPFVVGVNNGNFKIFNPISQTAFEFRFPCNNYPFNLIQSFVSGDNQLLLASTSDNVKFMEADSLSDEDEECLFFHTFDGCKAARFSHFGNNFAAIPLESAHEEILLYDIQTFQLKSKFSDACITFRDQGHYYAQIHFSHCDSMLLWNGILWDHRISTPVHRFDQITDCGGGGFHPAGNEVIINSEVLDIRKLRLLHSIPSLNKTTIKFNGGGDVIYAILRRDIDEYVMSEFNPRRAKHPLYAAFRTVDAVNYSDIATTSVDHCVLDFTAETTDLFVGLVTMSKKDGCEKDEAECEEDDMYGSIQIYEIGKQEDSEGD